MILSWFYTSLDLVSLVTLDLVSLSLVLMGADVLT